MSKVSYWRLIGSMHSLNKKASKKDCKRKAICWGSEQTEKTLEQLTENKTLA